MSQYKPLPSGKKRVILGLMTFGPDVDRGARVTDLEQFKSALDYFQSQGYNEVDTAWSYVGGKQQAFTRQADWQGRKLKLATKFYPSTDPSQGGHDAANIRKRCEENLKELGSDSTDIFYLHAADRNVNFATTLEECNKLHQEGKFKQLGVSNFTAYEVAECVMICQERGWVRPTVYQGMYNAITRGLEETIIACHRYGIEVVVYNPIAGGLLSGKMKTKDDIPQDEHSRFGLKSSARAGYSTRYLRDTTFEAIDMIRETAEEHQLSMVEVALRWVMHHSSLNVAKDEGDGIIIGVSSEDQLRNNLKELEKGPLPEKVLEVLDRAWIHVKGTAAPYWHGKLEYGYDTQKALFGK